MSLPFHDLEKLTDSDFYLLDHADTCCKEGCGVKKETAFYYDRTSGLRFRCPVHIDPVWIKLDEKDLFTLRCLH